MRRGGLVILTVAARILVAYLVGFLSGDWPVRSCGGLGFAPHDRCRAVALRSRLRWPTNVALATAGNLVRGLLLITLTHTAQVKGSSGGD